MSFLGAFAALAALVAFVRLARRSLVLASLVCVLVLSLGGPAIQSLSATVSDARAQIHRWQQGRIAAGACSFTVRDCGARQK
jgi:hypothetical protein